MLSIKCGKIDFGKKAYVNSAEIMEALKTMGGLGDFFINKGKLIQLIELVESGTLTEEKASEAVGMTLDEFRKEMKKKTVTV